MTVSPEPSKLRTPALGYYQTLEGHLELERALGGTEQFDRLDDAFRRFMPKEELQKLDFAAPGKTVPLVMEYASQFFNTYSRQVAQILHNTPDALQRALRAGIRPLDRFTAHLLTSLLISHQQCITTLGQFLYTRQEQDASFERMLHPTRKHGPIPISSDSRFLLNYVEDGDQDMYCLLPDYADSFQHSTVLLTNTEILTHLQDK